LTKSVP